MLLNTSEFACKWEDSGSGTTSPDITINVRPLIMKLHFIIYFVTDPLTGLMASVSVLAVTHPHHTMS